MKKMTDIQEEILLSYFPEFLDTQMLKFIELKFKLEEELESLTGWNERKNNPQPVQGQKNSEN